MNFLVVMNGSERHGHILTCNLMNAFVVYFLLIILRRILVLLYCLCTINEPFR